jgi:hypothetical protein
MPLFRELLYVHVRAPGSEPGWKGQNPAYGIVETDIGKA